MTDLLPFSAEDYWSLFEPANALAWPLALPLAMLVAIAWALSVDGRPGVGRFAGVVLGLAWGVVAFVFFHEGYRALDEAAGYAFAAFLVQAILLGGLGAGGWLAPRPGARAGLVASVLILGALVVYPVLAPAFDRPLAVAEVFAVSPDPTALATLGFVALAGRAWVRWLLAAIPLVWLGIDAATLFILDQPKGWVLVAALALAGVALSWRDRPPAPGSGRPAAWPTA